MLNSRPRSIALAFASAAVAFSAAAAPRIDAQDAAAQFRAGVDAITLNVSVTDKQRRPVRGLSREDFTVLEEGKPQRIVSFSEEAIPSAWEPGPAWREQFPRDVATNGGNAQRLVVLIMSYKIGADPWAVKKAKEVAHDVIRHLGPDDLASVVWSQRSSDGQGFTSDPAKLHAAVERMRPGSPWSTTKCALENLVDVLADFPEKRRVIIEIMEPLDAASHSRRPTPVGALGGGGTAFMTPPLPVRCSSSTMPFAAQAQRANVVMYKIDSNGLRTDPVFDMEENPTGGRFIGNTNAPERAVDGIFVENSSFYLIAYESDRTRPREGFRRVDVKVNRSGVNVHGPRNWYSLEPSAKDLRNPKKIPSPLVKAITEVLPAADVPLRAIATPFAVPGKSTTAVAITLGVTLPGAKRGAATTETLTVEERAYSLEGKLRATVRQDVTIALRPDGSDAHIEVLSQMELKPDRYEIRMSIQSSALKETASVYADVLVPNFFKDALTLSGIVMSTDPAITAAPKGVLASLLPIVPTTQREFAAGATTELFVRVYQKEKDQPLAVSTVLEIRDAADKVIVRQQETVAAGQFGVNRSADVRWKLPRERLTPGPYLVVVTASAGTTTAQQSTQIVLR